MNKTTKGAIAAGAAAVLLAGGAGTMAAWNASTGAGGSQTVNAGSMTISEAAGSGVWKLGANTFNPASDKIVPGDVLTYTATYNYTLVGTNLKATLTPTVGGISGALASKLEVATAGGQNASVTAGTGTRDITTTITFKPDTTNTDGAGQAATLSGASVTLEQTLTP